MVDVVDSKTRSRMMSGIKGKNTKPEVRIRRLLHRNGFRYRIHVRDMAGKPDIVLPKFKAVIFVHGCFWHGHECRYFKWPKTREDFWRNKILGNRKNDKSNIQILMDCGWRVCQLWECAVRDMDEDEILKELVDWLQSGEDMKEIKS